MIFQDKRPILPSDQEQFKEFDFSLFSERFWEDFRSVDDQF